MRNISAIMKKQLKDTLKNKPVLIQFIIFPVMAVIMAKFVGYRVWHQLIL